MYQKFIKECYKNNYLLYMKLIIQQFFELNHN